jgi:short-subunit dehydrogenase
MSTKKVALITGATSGIGKDIAKCFAINGYTIIIVGRDQTKLHKTAEEFRKQYGADVTTILADLAQPGAAEKVFEAVKGKNINVLVNNAGFALSGEFAEQPTEDILELLRINIESITNLTRLILPDMLDRRNGRILNIASTAAFQPGPNMAVFHATKSYVLSFSEAIRYELKGTGVTISTLCPGPTDTNFHKRAQVTSSRLFKMGMMRSDDVARIAYNGLMDGDPLIIPGFKNRLSVILAKFAPRGIALKTMYKLNRTE